MADFTLGDPRERYTTASPVRGGLRAEVARPAGSGVGNSNFRAAGPGDEMMPAFLAKAVEPYIKKKQEEAFRRGAIEQMQAGAEVDVTDDEHNIVSNIWGPNHAEQGAAAMRTKMLVLQQEQDWTNRLPDLIDLPPQELAKALAGDAEKLKTGNRWTDDLLEGEMLQSLQRTVQVVTQKRTEHIQKQASQGYVDAIVGSAVTLDQYEATRQEAEGEAGNQAPDVSARQNFIGMFASTPAGLLPERQIDLVNTAFTSVIEKHAFRSYQYAKDSGLIATLPQEMQDKLNERYEAEGRTALAAASEAVNDDIFRLHTRMQKAALGPDWKPTPGDEKMIMPMEAVTAALNINAKLSKITGVRMDFMDPEAIRKVGFSVIDAMADADKAAAARAFTTSERLASQEAKALEKQQEAQRSVVAFRTGVFADAELSGKVDHNVGELEAARAAQAGDFAPLVANFLGRGTVFTKAADTLQTPINGSKGLGYTNDLDNSRLAWEKLNALNPGAAMAYYGKEYDGIRRVSQLVNGQKMPPQLAWMRIYGETMLGAQIEIKPERRKEATTSIDTWVNKNHPDNFLTVFGAGPMAWNDSAKLALHRSIADQVALMQDSTMPMDQIVAGAKAAREADGSLEGYGPFMWEQRSGTTPLYKRTGPNGVPRDTFEAAFYREADTRLRKASGGKVNGHTQAIDIFRQDNADGSTTVMIAGGDGTGKTHYTTFTTADLYARIKADSLAETRKAQDVRDWAAGNPKTLKESFAVVGAAQAAREAKQAAKGSMEVVGFSPGMAPFHYDNGPVLGANGIRVGVNPKAAKAVENTATVVKKALGKGNFVGPRAN